MTDQAPQPAAPPLAKRRRSRLLPALIVAGVAGAAAGAALVIPRAPAPGTDAAECAAAVQTATRISPLIKGEVAAFVPATRPLRLPDLAFKDKAGEETRLSRFRGKATLVNLWATWCIPCLKEMPALDALEGRLGGPAFQVLAINTDQRNLDAPAKWLADKGIARLGNYADPSTQVMRELKVVGRATGLPTTVLLDEKGCEIGFVPGAADWASPEAITLLEAALKK